VYVSLRIANERVASTKMHRARLIDFEPNCFLTPSLFKKRFWQSALLRYCSKQLGDDELCEIFELGRQRHITGKTFRLLEQHDVTMPKEWEGSRIREFKEGNCIGRE
jgi:hypothetical protein